MAENKYGIATPQYQALDPDTMQVALSKIAYANNPIAAGLALSGENIGKEMRDNRYLEQLRQSNALSNALAQQDMSNQLNTSILQYAPNWQKEMGYSPDVVARVGGMPQSPEYKNAANANSMAQRLFDIVKTKAGAVKDLGAAYNDGLVSDPKMLAGLDVIRTGPRSAEIYADGSVAAAAAGNESAKLGTRFNFKDKPIQDAARAADKARIMDQVATETDNNKVRALLGEAAKKQYIELGGEVAVTDSFKGAGSTDKVRGGGTSDKAPPPPNQVKAAVPPNLLEASRAQQLRQLDAKTYVDARTGQKYDLKGNPLK